MQPNFQYIAHPEEARDRPLGARSWQTAANAMVMGMRTTLNGEEEEMKQP